MVGVGRLELPASWSQTRRAANCATPRDACLTLSVGQKSWFSAGALGFAGESTRGATDRVEMTVIEVAHFGSVHEQNAVAQPVESVRQDDLALGALGNVVDPCLGRDRIAHLQVDLTLMRVCEGVWLPERHVPIIAGK